MIYYPFYYASIYGRGFAIKADTECDSYSAGDETSSDYKKNGFDKIPYLDVSAILSDDKQKLSLFVINRSLEEDVDLDIGLEGYALKEHIELTGELKDENSFDNPNNIVPNRKSIDGKVVLSSKSWNMILFEK